MPGHNIDHCLKLSAGEQLYQADLKLVAGSSVTRLQHLPLQVLQIGLLTMLLAQFGDRFKRTS